MCAFGAFLYMYCLTQNLIEWFHFSILQKDVFFIKGIIKATQKIRQLLSLLLFPTPPPAFYQPTSYCLSLSKPYTFTSSQCFQGCSAVLLYCLTVIQNLYRNCESIINHIQKLEKRQRDAWQGTEQHSRRARIRNSMWEYLCICSYLQTILIAARNGGAALTAVHFFYTAKAKRFNLRTKCSNMQLLWPVAS